MRFWVVKLKKEGENFVYDLWVDDQDGKRLYDEINIKKLLEKIKMEILK